MFVNIMLRNTNCAKYTATKNIHVKKNKAFLRIP